MAALRQWSGEVVVEGLCCALGEDWGEREDVTESAEVVEINKERKASTLDKEDMTENIYNDYYSSLEEDVGLGELAMEQEEGKGAVGLVRGEGFVEQGAEEGVDVEEQVMWGEESCAYSRGGGGGARHDLARMHREQWWGREQFCPADRHQATTNRELDRRREEWQERGRRGAPVPGGVGISRCAGVS